MGYFFETQMLSILEEEMDPCQNLLVRMRAIRLPPLLVFPIHSSIPIDLRKRLKAEGIIVFFEEIIQCGKVVHTDTEGGSKQRQGVGVCLP